MRKTKGVCVVLIWLLTFNINAKGVDCSSNCFHSEIINSVSFSEGCTTYTILVFADGDCAHALSHYTVGVPSCAEIKEVSNSESWKIEYGTDPTTGISGFKVDDIQEFGESVGSFTVTYTLCEGGCDDGIDCHAPTVAYKAATCVYYEEIDYSCSKLEADLTVTQNLCASAFDGAISVNILDGEEPYTYQWSNGATSSEITNLSHGAYSVLVTDASGESLELNAEITSPEALEISYQIGNASCAGQSDGAVDATIAGGIAPYTYSWSNGEITEDLESVAGGYYILTVTDANGCSETAPALVENSVFINVNGLVTNSGCASDNGSIDITVEGGVSPYTFQWSNGETTEDLNGLSMGNYNVVVTDANGCFSSRSFFVNENNPIRISAISNPTACVEDNSGSIDLTVVDGQEPYTYAWSNGETTEDIMGLAAGVYTVTVSDATGCDVTSSFVINTNTFSASSMVNQISCSGSSDGSIELMVSDGTAPYTYNWSNGETTQTIEGLSFGLYSVTIEDSAGCSKDLSFYLPEPTALSANYSVANPSCTEGDFEVVISATGGTAPYTFDWDNGLTANQEIALDSGNYSVIITDAKGCTTSLDMTVNLAAASCDDSNDDGSDDSGDGNDDGSGDDGSGDDGTGDDSGDDGSGGDGSDDDSGDDGSGDGSGDDSDDDSDDGNDDDSDGDDNGDACDNPFNTEITLISESDDCYTYTATISYNGNHVHGLSHWTMDISCGSISDVSNSENWPIEFGKDPTTGLNGFKIDNINGFGEGEFSEEFEVTFTVCSSEPACLDEYETDGFEIAYKYGQCVSYENQIAAVNWTNRLEVNAYPNPFTSSSTISLNTPKSTKVKVEVYNRQGLMVKELFNGQSNDYETLDIKFDAFGLPSDIYTYKITTNYGVKYGKLVLTNHN